MHIVTKLTLSIPSALFLLAPLATPAVADTAPDTVIAADTTPEQPAAVAPASVSRMVGIDANIVNGLTVTGAGGSRVTLTARGERTRTRTATTCRTRTPPPAWTSTALAATTRPSWTTAT